MPSERLAVYTTVYSGAEPYLSAWYQSVSQQIDRNFDLYISLDSLSADAVKAAIGCDPKVTFFPAAPRSSPAQIRSAALEGLVDDYDAVVLVDSDDFLDPSRVSAARAAMRRYDLVGCALRIVDEAGDDLGVTFGPTPGVDYDRLLPSYNIFGLSNSAYRSQVLRRCLPIPADCVLIDWLLATRAWAGGATLAFDFTPRMAYRRHSKNTTPLLQPFTAQQILTAAQLVVEHYRLVLLMNEHLAASDTYCARLKIACDRAECFQRAIASKQDKLERYVRELNRLTPTYVWWWCVAHPELEEIWRN